MNIYDIARLSGVSITTVSRVLNNKPNVSRATREKVRAVLDESDFIPSSAARGLATSKSNIVGILTIDMRIPHYASTIFALESELHANGFRTVICNTGGDPDRGHEYLRMLYDNGACCAIILGSVFKNVYSFNAYPDLSYLLINYQAEVDNSCSVLIDDKYGLRIALEHLISKGHKNIAYVQDAKTQSGARKKEFFLDLSAEMGLDASPKHAFCTDRSFEGGMKVFSAIQSSALNPTAIIVGDDLTALGVCRAAQNSGLVIPSDLAVIGYNNSLSGRISAPALTTVDTKCDVTASCSVMMMKNMLDNRQTSRLIMVQPELIVREST